MTDRQVDTAQSNMGQIEAGVPKGKCYSIGNPVFSCTVDIPVESKQSQIVDQGSEWFEGYKPTSGHPMYRTSNSSYGSRKPTVHTMPTTFHAKSQKFSEHLGNTGMYRNHSLNCAMDKTIVTDH